MSFAGRVIAYHPANRRASTEQGIVDSRCAQWKSPAETKEVAGLLAFGQSLGVLLQIYGSTNAVSKSPCRTNGSPQFPFL